MSVRLNKMPRELRRYLRNREGASAIEFAILALPFAALVFAIMELAIVFFLTATMAHATSEVSREIRVGSFQETCTDNAAAFKQKICDKMYGLGNCQQNLRVDVMTSRADGRFHADLMPTIPDPNPPIDPATGNPTIQDDCYVSTPARAVVVVRAQYYHKLALPTAITRLANQPGNTRLLTARTAFRNEPFPGTCPPPAALPAHCSD